MIILDGTEGFYKDDNGLEWMITSLVSSIGAYNCYPVDRDKTNVIHKMLTKEDIKELNLIRSLTNEDYKVNDKRTKRKGIIK